MANFALTQTESDVIRLLATGKRASDIAAELGISRRTVYNHRASAAKKIGIDSTRELIIWAVKIGLTEVA